MNKTTDFQIGDRVIYKTKHQSIEEGTVTSINDSFVFVCYGLPGSTSKATRPQDLYKVK